MRNLDLLDLVKNKAVLTFDFSQIEPADTNFRRILYFYLNSLPEEQQEPFRQQLVNSIRSKSKLTLDFGNLPIPDYLGKGSDLLKQQLGVPVLPTLSEVETRLKQIEQARKQRALKPSEIEEKERLEYIKEQVLPVEEIGLGQIQKVLEKTRDKLAESLTQELERLDKEIMQTRREASILRKLLDKAPPLSADAVKYANMLKQAQDKLVSNVATRRKIDLYVKHLQNKDKWYEDLWVGFIDGFFREAQAPFLRGVISIEEKDKARQVVEKRRLGKELTESEQALLRELETRHLASQSLPYNIGYGLAGMPAWSAEILILGKLLALLGVSKAIVSLITRYLSVKAKAPKKLLEFLTFGAIQGAVNVPYIASEMFDRMLDEYVVVPQGDRLVSVLNRQGDDFWTALSKAFGSSVVEHSSEFMGSFIQGWRKFFPKWVLTRFVQKKGIKKVDDIMQLIKKGMRWHGILGEVFEEEVARIGHAVLEGGYTPPWTDEGLRILLQEFITIGAWGGLLSLPNLPTRLRETTQRIQEYRQQYRPPLITDEVVKRISEQKKAPKEATISPEIQQVIDEALVTPPPPPSEERVVFTAPPKVKINNDLFKDVATIESLQEIYRKSFNALTEERNKIRSTYDEYIKTLREEMTEQAKLVNYDPEVLEEQINDIVKDIIKERDILLEKTKRKELSLIASYNKRLKELQELEKAVEPPKVTTIQLWQNTLPVPVEPILTEQEISRLKNIAKKTEELLNQQLPQLDFIQKEKIIASLYNFKIALLPFESIKIRPEIQEQLRPFLRYNLALVDAIAKFFDITFYDLLKIAYIESLGENVLFDGHHRYVALSKLKSAGQLQDIFPEGIPVVIFNFKNLDELMAKIVLLRMVNEARHGLNIVEQAKAYQDLINSGYKVKDIASLLGKKVGDIEDVLFVNKLSQEWKLFAINKEQLPRHLQKIATDKLIITMANIVNKYNLPEVVQNEILDIVKEEKVNATTLGDWLENVLKNVETVVKKEEKTGTLSLFSPQEFKRLKSAFKDTLFEYRKVREELAGSLSSYKKVVKDLEKRAKRGEKIPKGTIEHHKNVIKEFEKEIRKLQKFILETYKNRPLTQRELQELEKIKIHFKEPTKNFFEFIDEKYGELHEYSLFPDERPTNLGFRMVNDMRQIPTLLTLEVVEDRVVAKKTIISPPVDGYDYFLVVSPVEQLLFGVEKQGRTEIENASLLAKFLGFTSALAKDVKDTHLLLLKLSEGKVYADTRFLDDKPLSKKDHKLVEKGLRQYFKPHVPVQFGLNKSDMSEQLLLFREEVDKFYEAPIQTAVEENLSLVLPGGFLTLKKPVDFSLENIKKLFKYAGLSLITPHHEIAVVLGLKENKIVSLEVLSGIQKMHDISFDLLFYQHYKDADKIVFLHRHPSTFVDELVKWVYSTDVEEIIAKRFEALPKEKYKDLIQEFRKLFAVVKDTIKKLPQGIQTKYVDFEKMLREKLTAEQIDALYQFFTKYKFLPSVEDVELIERYKKILGEKVSDVIYIFNDAITEINLKTWQMRSVPYEKTFLEQVERIKSVFEDIPFWWHWNYYQRIGIKFDNKIAYALLDILKKYEGWAIFTKDGKIVRITHLPSLFEVFKNKKDALKSAYIFSFDTVHIFSPKGYVDEKYQEFINLKNDAERFGVNFLLHAIQQDNNITTELTHFAERPKTNRVYQNILKRYGQYFTENELRLFFERRFGYPFAEIEKEDGAEFRRFLEKLILTPDEKKSGVIDKWVNREVDFAKIKQKIKTYVRRVDRPTLLRQLRVYMDREPVLFDKLIKTIAGEVKDFRQLDTDTLRTIVSYIALAEADENLRKTVEFLQPGEIELAFTEKLKYGLTDFNIVDATFLRLSKRYPIMRNIRDSIFKYLMEKDRIRGRCYVQISEIEKVLGRDFIKTKFDTFVDYIETGVLSDRLTDEEKEKVKKAYNLYKNMMDYIFMLASDAGVIMYDPIRGLFVPIQYRENYFPHFYEKDYLESLMRDERMLEEVAKANKMSVEEAKLMLELQREDLKSRTFANIEMHRLYNVPGYKKTFDVLVEYIRRASDRIAWVREFGNDVFIAPGRGYMPIKLYTMLSKIDNKEVRDYVKHVFSVLLYKHYLSYEVSNSIFRALRKIQVPKLMTAWIENLWQWFINFAPKVPYTKVMDAMIKRITTLGYGREILEFYGLSEQLGRALIQMYGEEKDDVFDKIASMTLSLGFVQTERNNRVMVALLGKEYADYLRKLLQKGKVDKVKYELETLGVTQNLIKKIIKQKDITQEDEFEIIWTANSMTNYLVDLWFMPFIMSKSELFKTIFQFFGTFYVPQTRMITRMYIKPFFEYIRSGGKRGNVSGFAKMMLHVVIASILARAVRDYIGRRKLLLPKEDWDRVANIMFFILLSGWFGLYALPIEFILYGADAIKDRFIGVGFNHFLTTLDELFKLNFPKVIEIQTPMLRYFMNWATKRISYYTPPTYNLHYNLVRNLQRSYEYSQKTLGSQHFFTQFLYKLYLQQRANFLKKYGGIYTKLKGQILPLRTLRPSRAEIISRTEGL